MPRKLTLSDAQAVAKEHGGECLATSYTNAKTPIPWRCEQAHVWNATLDSVKNRGSWCSLCAIERNSLSRMHTVADMQKLAIERDAGGQFISPIYLGFNKLHWWRCSAFHEWKATPNNIQTKGSWCPHCSGNARKSLEDMQLLAASRGGKCLSTAYVNNGSKLEWECGNGHQWHATPGSVSSGRWCPECSTGLGERICRIIFESIFNTKFERVRPKWLTDDKGARLELDGYNESLQLAFEHQGEQHYSTRGQRNKVNAEQSLALQIQRDQFKAAICEQRGITLIHIPEIGNRLKVDAVINFILEELTKAGSAWLSGFDANEVDLLPAFCPKLLQEFQDLARLRGGRLLSTAYINMNTALHWECKVGHQWHATPAKIKHRGDWCPTCAGRNKTIDDLHAAAAKRDGQCLATVYMGMEASYPFICKNGHSWKASANNIINHGTWCRPCSGHQKKTLADMQALASARSGECLSDEYLGAHVKLTWRCQALHVWDATPHSIQGGRWCASCAGRKKKTFRDMHQLAPALGLKCLHPETDEYVGAKQKLAWQCSALHQFERCYDKLRVSAKCPNCPPSEGTA